MKIDHDVEKAVRSFLARISLRYDIAGAILFGSRARGTHAEDSDADLAILLRGPRGNTPHVAGDMSGDAFDVLMKTGIDIQPVPVWMDQWERPETAANPALLKNIASEGIWL
jgi:predicted nucleotidyltransferase